MTKTSIKCDICCGNITDLTYIDTNNYELCVFCKSEEQFLEDWRKYRNKKHKREIKLNAGVNLIQKEKICDDVVSKILQYI